jgi:transposase-like protein
MISNSTRSYVPQSETETALNLFENWFDPIEAGLREWRLKHRAVADSLQEAGDRLFTFTGLPPSQWRSARTTNAIERLHEEFKRRIKTQTVLPSAETAAMLFWALLASGQINMRKVDGWPTLGAGHFLLISGFKVRVLVRPPIKSKAYETFRSR